MHSWGKGKARRRKQCFAWRGLATPAECLWLGISGFIIHNPTSYSSSGDPWRCGGGKKKEARRRGDHLTYSDGIEGRVAIFRTLDFGAPFLWSVGVPGLKVSEQLSWELDGHGAALGLPFMGKERRERAHTLVGTCVEGSRPPFWLLPP